MIYQITFSARKRGAIGFHATERYSVTVQASDVVEARAKAFDAALQGGAYETLEHLHLIAIDKLTNMQALKEGWR